MLRLFSSVYDRARWLSAPGGSSSNSSSGSSNSSSISVQHGGGIDYFVSSSLFERGAASQCKYSERLLLQSGMTTHFARPPRPMFLSELTGGESGGESGGGDNTSAAVHARDHKHSYPNKIQFLRHLFQCRADGPHSHPPSPSLSLESRAVVCGWSDGQELLLLGVPQVCDSVCV